METDMSVKLMPLGEVANIYSGSNLKNGQAVFGDGGCPWVRVEDLNHSELKETSRNLSLEGMKQAKLSPVDTVFFSATGTIGKVGIARVPMAPSNNMFALEFDERRIVPLYGMYCLAAMKEVFKAEAGGAVYASLRLSVFRKIRIPVPDLNTQRRIAGKLKALYQSEHLQKQINGRMKEAASGLFDRYFGELVENTVRGKVPCLRLGDCADIVLNGAAKKKQGEGAPVLYVSTPQLKDWEIRSGQVPKTEIDPEKKGLYSLHDGDIVMNRINSAERLGRCGIVLEEPEESVVFGQNTLRIRSREGVLQPLFLFAWLRHPYIKQYIQSNAKNSTSFQSSLNKQVLSDLPVPPADLTGQTNYAREFKHYFEYIRTAEKTIETLKELQQIWYGKIRLFLQQGKREEIAGESMYEKGRYWITPSGVVCYYDSYLECIQVPGEEIRTIRLSQLPMEVEVQFLDGVRTAQQDYYGELRHVRLKRIGRNVLWVITMVPVAYGVEEEGGEDSKRQIEENGILSEQQDFGYIRQIREIDWNENENIGPLLSGDNWRDAPASGTSFAVAHPARSERWTDGREEYSRFRRLPDSARRFISRLSAFQQAVFEEFLLAMQPLACHMVGKQVAMRSGESYFQDYGLQDVIAVVRFLDHAGLLERKQGLYLSYDGDYGQGEKRQMILDHRGRPIPIDTWACADVKG